MQWNRPFSPQVTFKSCFVFISKHRSICNRNCYWKWAIAVTDQTELPWWARQTVECLEFSGSFCGNVEDKNSEGSADNGGLACELSEKGRLSWGCLHKSLKFVEVKPFDCNHLRPNLRKYILRVMPHRLWCIQTRSCFRLAAEFLLLLMALKLGGPKESWGH